MKRKTVRILVRIFYSALLLAASAVTLLLVFLSQLDLEDYRHSLEEQLASALKQPVSIGHSTLTYNDGLALELEQLRIGEESSPYAQIPRITATLRLRPLLDGQFILDQVRLEQPRFNLRLPFPDRPARGTSHQLLNSLGISILTVQGAELNVYQTQAGETVKRASISNLHMVLKGWQPQQTGLLVVTGRIPEHQAEFLLETQLPSSVDPDIWRREVHKTRLQVSHFSTARFPRFHNQDYPAALNLEVQIDGAPATGTLFDARLSAAGTAEELFTLTGHWTSSEKQDAITGLQGRLLDIPLSGEFHYLRQPREYNLTGRFGAGEIALTPELFRKWRVPNADKLLGGDLERLSIKLDKSWNPQTETPGIPEIAAELTLCNLNWDIPEVKQFQDLSVDLRLENDRLDVRDGILVAGGQVFDFSGGINNLLLHPQFDLDVNFDPHLAELARQMTIPDNWSLAGHLPGKLQLSGPLLHPEFQLSTDLAQIDLNLDKLFRVVPGGSKRLELRGRLAAKTLQLEQLALQLDKLKISANGTILREQGEVRFNAELDPVDLEQLKTFSPLLQSLQARGTLATRIESLNNGLSGTLQLDRVGAHLTSVISDLNNTSGVVDFNRSGLSFRNLRTALGESNLLLNGTMENWRNPQLSLQLKGRNVHANDLIFLNQEMVIDDLDGELHINREGIRFSPVNVKLGTETEAIVNGSVTDFKKPEVSLDIRSKKVNVLHIIDLFNGPRQMVNDIRKRGHTRVRITVAADQGTLGGLRFTNAHGLIRDQDGLLTIFPLEFDNDEGSCQARVVFNRREQQRPLKVSGHMEGINASVLHQDLFSSRGLINGRLKGDFYVEGDPGHKDFWATAKGGIHIQVTEGTLRKFHSLSKVFSLLNVSQIFAGKLPDMDKDGMPFNLLEGSLKIADGLAATEDLKINSEAMNLSMVGNRNLVDKTLDFILGIMPLRTVDKVITSIPVAGWVLTGEDKALITAQFRIEGTDEDPQVTPIPINSVSNTVLGIFKRTLGLPGKLVKDIGSIFQKEPEKKVEP